MPKPTRVGTAFKNMMSTCPGEVAAYGKCVVLNVDDIEKGSCEKEFSALKKCFRTVKHLRK